MDRFLVLLCVSLLGLSSGSEGPGTTTPTPPPTERTATPGAEAASVAADEWNESAPTIKCTSCTGRDLKRSYRLESIKTDILRKLRMSAPPNVTGLRLPNVPLLNQMIANLSNTTDTGHYGSTGSGSDVDDDRLLTMRVIQFSKPGWKARGVVTRVGVNLGAPVPAHTCQDLCD